MNAQEFGMQIERLKNTFGEKHFVRERADLIWAEVKNQSADWLASVTSKFIGERPLGQPPLVPDFRAALAIDRERAWSARKPISSYEANNSCGECISGIIRARLRSDPSTGMYVFKCRCSIGSSDLRRFPEWSEHYAKEFNKI